MLLFHNFRTHKHEFGIAYREDQID